MREHISISTHYHYTRAVIIVDCSFYRNDLSSEFMTQAVIVSPTDDCKNTLIIQTTTTFYTGTVSQYKVEKDTKWKGQKWYKAQLMMTSTSLEDRLWLLLLISEVFILNSLPFFTEYTRAVRVRRLFRFVNRV